MAESDIRTEALRVSAREFVFQRFACRVVAGPEAGRLVLATGPELLIGSAPGNDLVLTDPTVSRHHCALRVTELGFQVRDLDSTNGTILAGYRVQSAFVDSGALLSLGATTVRFEIVPGEVREQLSESDTYGTMIGASPGMRRIFALLPRLASSDATVLIGGQTGTGKGVLAEAIHQASPRHRGPFVTVDCAALPATLIQSELFGHERGSFTHAVDTRIGAFEVAQGGTVFIDEVGELSLDMQPKLLRVLEKRQVMRVGSNVRIPLDVRVIAATNRDLRKEVNRGRFRADLFYRLNILRVELPALDERREDIPLLVERFYREHTGDPQAVPSPQLVGALTEQSWPGNIRQLRSAVERAVLLGTAGWEAGWAEKPTGRPPTEPDAAELSFRDAKARAVDAWERQYLAELVGRFEGNLSRAARAVQMNRNHLRDLLRRHGILERNKEGQ